MPQVPCTALFVTSFVFTLLFVFATVIARAVLARSLVVIADILHGRYPGQRGIMQSFVGDATRSADIRARFPPRLISARATPRAVFARATRRLVFLRATLRAPFPNAPRASRSRRIASMRTCESPSSSTPPCGSARII
jgi:hypothetical protein